jgi:hypothetical protein
MGTKSWEVLCDEHGISVDAQLGRINVFYHEASDGKNAPRALLSTSSPARLALLLEVARSASLSARKTS